MNQKRKRDLKVQALERIAALIERDIAADLVDHWDSLTTEEVERINSEFRREASLLRTRADYIRKLGEFIDDDKG